MMIYRIHITSAAERDLNHAADHIDYVLKNPKAADDLLDHAEKRINLLCEFPQKFQLVDDPVLASWGIRFITIDNYLAFYTIDTEKNLVTIVRFLYQKSNWKSILRHQNTSRS